jgi:hypothetical protein
MQIGCRNQSHHVPLQYLLPRARAVPRVHDRDARFETILQDTGMCDVSICLLSNPTFHT